MKLRVAKKVIAKYTIGLHTENKGRPGHVYIGLWAVGPLNHIRYDRSLCGRINFHKAMRILNKWLRKRKRNEFRGFANPFDFIWIQF